MDGLKPIPTSPYPSTAARALQLFNRVLSPLRGLWLCGPFPGFRARRRAPSWANICRSLRELMKRVSLCLRDPTLRQKKAKDGATHFVVDWRVKSKSRSPFDSDRIRDLRSGQALGSVEERFARDDRKTGNGD